MYARYDRMRVQGFINPRPGRPLRLLLPCPGPEFLLTHD
jgi:hypothetical protein